MVAAIMVAIGGVGAVGRLPAAAAVGTDRLQAGEQLGAVGDALTSADGTYRLILTTGGDVAEFAGPGGRVLFRTFTYQSDASPAGARLLMQGDGNLVVYSSGWVPVWSSHTYGNPGAYLLLQDDGNVVVYSATNRPLWASGVDPVPPRLRSGVLRAGDALQPGVTMTSPQGRSRMDMQTDGNLVVYGSFGAVFSSDTFRPGSYLAMQDDGNAVVYDPAGRPLWNSGTYTLGRGAQLALSDDGAFAVKRADGSVAWDSRTGRPSSFTDGQDVGTIRPGTSFYSGLFQAVMQTDGNFVLYRSGRPVWATWTMIPGSYLVPQDDGQLVLFSPAGRPLWTTGKGAGAPRRLRLLPDGRLALLNAGLGVEWSQFSPPAPALGGSTMPTHLYAGQSLVNGAYTALLQFDGNLVIYRDGVARWATWTTARDPYLYFAYDTGALQLMDSWGGPPRFTTGPLETWAHLTLQADGRLQVLSRDTGAVLWSSP
ncbi:MAG: hypothetical protein JWL64_1781 [Frankiales bacterium]|nr:hypothetical protein [Frankiales bacterium]